MRPARFAAIAFLMSASRMAVAVVLCGTKNFLQLGHAFAVDGWSCVIFCIGRSEGLFLIASSFGASAFRMGST